MGHRLSQICNPCKVTDVTFTALEVTNLYIGKNQTSGTAVAPGCKLSHDF